jgi:hypothetical protein
LLDLLDVVFVVEKVDLLVVHQLLEVEVNLLLERVGERALDELDSVLLEDLAQGLEGELIRGDLARGCTPSR